VRQAGDRRPTGAADKPCHRQHIPAAPPDPGGIGKNLHEYVVHAGQPVCYVLGRAADLPGAGADTGFTNCAPLTYSDANDPPRTGSALSLMVQKDRLITR